MPGISHAPTDLSDSESEVEDEESLTRRVVIDEDEEEMFAETNKLVKENKEQVILSGWDKLGECALAGFFSLYYF